MVILITQQDVGLEERDRGFCDDGDLECYLFSLKASVMREFAEMEYLGSSVSNPMAKGRT